MKPRTSAMTHAIPLMVRVAWIVVATFAAVTPAAAGGPPPETNPTMCGQAVSGKVVLKRDIICANVSGVNGLTVVGPNTTISFKGFSIKCMHAAGYKFSCQDQGDFGIDTCGFSNVTIEGPGMIQGFQTGVRVRGMPAEAASTPPCPSGVPANATNVKVKKLNVTGPDGRQDISEPLAGPRPISVGIHVSDFIENGKKKDVEVSANAVDNHRLGIALVNSSRVDVRQNFVHDNNSAGESTTGAVTPGTTTTIINGGQTTITAPEDSHGIIVCAGGLCPGSSLMNDIRDNLVVDNGQNLHSNTANNDSMMPADGGITLTGSNVRQNKVHGNIVIGNNGDGISVRDDASLNQIEKNSANYNTSTDAQGGYLANGDPAAPFFWDIAFRNAPSNTVKPDNRCLTQSPSVTPANVCGPDENATWFDGKH